MAIRYKQDSELASNIFSSDKDLKQLLDNNVFVTDPWKWTLSKTKDFIQDFLFEPKYILDYLSLIWDAADNIKWVAGIWPKWASTLIIKYKTIENIYNVIDEAEKSWIKNIDWISQWIKEKLLVWREEAFKAKSLIELETIPESELKDIETFKFDIDFDNYKKVLVQQQNFIGMDKSITELKNKYHMPQQNSLF
jgi:DNA polymerase-1